MSDYPPALSILRQAEALDTGIRGMQLGKKRISGRKIAAAIMRGEMLDVDGARIDPNLLPIKVHLKKGVDLEMADTTIGRLRARKMVTADQYYAGTWFRELYRSAFGIPEGGTVNLDGVSGGIKEFKTERQRDACEYYGWLTNQFGKNDHHRLLVRPIAWDHDPTWINSPRKRGKIARPVDCGKRLEHQALLDALDSLVAVRAVRRAA